MSINRFRQIVLLGIAFFILEIIAMFYNDQFLPIELIEPKQMSAQVMTSPCKIIALPNKKYKQVEILQ